MSSPLVSVIVPSFNQGRFLRETLDSIFSQDYRPLEVIVSDGGSTDETVSIIREYEKRPELVWWSEPDKGVVDGVNKGLARARGEILAIQSSDDAYLQGAIGAAVGTFTSRPDLALVYGDVEYMDAGSRATGRTNLLAFDFADYVGKLQYIPQASAFFTAEALREVGLWDDSISYAADADLWLRIAARHPVAKIDRLMSRYRYHEAQRDSAADKVARDWDRCVRQRLVDGVIPRRLRRQALMGVHLTWHHYLPGTEWWRRTVHLYKAAWAMPAALLRTEFPKNELLPGRSPIWKALSKAKRALGFAPRAA